MSAMVPISELKVEQSTYDLFAIWLAGFFDGGIHPVGGNATVQFTTAVLGFAQSPLAQPLNPVPATAALPAVQPAGITMVFATCPGKIRRAYENVDGKGRQHVYYKPVRWNFWVRCNTADDSGRALCLQTAGLLEAVLANAVATRPLAAMGVHRIRPCAPEPIADTTYQLRLVKCEATLRYAVLSQV